MSNIVLVTGGYGFLGRATASMFKSRGYRVFGIGNGRWDAAEAQLHGFDTWLDAPVSMSGLLTLNQAFDIIVHCAGNGSVGYSLTNPLQDFKKTVEGTAELLEYVRLNNSTAQIVCPSSAGVYGAKSDEPIKITDPLNPISPYGYHKKIAEELCESYSNSYNLNIVIIRFFSIYGPGLTKQLLWDASNKLLSAKNSKVQFWGSGNETRDLINIDDATNLILKASQCKNRFSIFNGASGLRITVREILEILRDELGASANIEFNKIVRAGDPLFFHADISSANCLGWSAAVNIRDGIRQYVKWYKSLNYNQG
jgi:UDP-glucose 4-epimerase